MRGVVVGLMVLGIAGCGGVRYTGTEADMQQVARGTAELMKKDPNSDVVAAAGKGAHVALNMMLGAPQQEAQTVNLDGKPCVQMFSGCFASQDKQEPESTGKPDSYTGLPKDFWKTTSIGKD